MSAPLTRAHPAIAAQTYEEQKERIDPSEVRVLRYHIQNNPVATNPKWGQKPGSLHIQDREPLRV
jgi:hypothetical protein